MSEKEIPYYMKGFFVIWTDYDYEGSETYIEFYKEKKDAGSRILQLLQNRDVSESDVTLIEGLKRRFIGEWKTVRGVKIGDSEIGELEEVEK